MMEWSTHRFRILLDLKWSLTDMFGSGEDFLFVLLHPLKVGVLVAKTLSNASANPFIASAAGVYNPVLALDVFLVQVRPKTTAPMKK